LEPDGSSQVTDDVSQTPDELASALMKEHSDLRNQRISEGKLGESESSNRELAHAKDSHSKL
jgi:hypothetical protein